MRVIEGSVSQDQVQLYEPAGVASMDSKSIRELYLVS